MTTLDVVTLVSSLVVTFTESLVDFSCCPIEDTFVFLGGGTCTMVGANNVGYVSIHDAGSSCTFVVVEDAVVMGVVLVVLDMGW